MPCLSGAADLSNFFAAKNAAKLERLQITHVLVCAAELPHALATRAPHLVYSSLDLADNPSSMLPISEALAAIDAAEAAGGRVLVHCAAGGSRSASCVCAWLMRERLCRYDEALAFLRVRRWVAPNGGFEDQLRAYGSTLMGVPSSRHDQEQEVDLR